MWEGLCGTCICFTTSGGGPAAAGVRPRAALPPPQATSVRRAPPRTAATRTRALTSMCSPSLITRARLRRTGSLAIRPTTGRVVGRCPPGEPVPAGLGILCQTPFLEDRQRHRPHSPLARTCGETLLLQPGLELVRRGVGGAGCWGSGLQHISRPLGPVVAALQRGDVQRDRHQIVQQNRPRREWPHRGEPLEVSLARLAHLDPTHLLVLLRREVTEVLVVGLGAEHAAQRRDRPSGAAPAATELPLALQACVLGEDGPCAAQRAVPLPPRGR